MDVDELRGVSRAIFGNSYFLEVAAAVASFQEDAFLQRDVADTVSVDKGLVASPLKRLVEAGLLEKLPAEGQGRPLRRAASVFWETAREFRDELQNS